MLTGICVAVFPTALLDSLIATYLRPRDRTRSLDFQLLCTLKICIVNFAIDIFDILKVSLVSPHTYL